MFNVFIFFCGIVFTFIAFAFIKDAINADVCLRANYRDRKISSLGGLYFIVPFLLVIIVEVLYANINDKRAIYLSPVLIVVLGFAFLGLLDDLIGDKSSQGFKGHIKSLLKGRLTTGGLKLIGGPIISFLALFPYVHSSGYEIVILGTIAISLSANLINLFDLAPGRALKVSTVAMIVSAIIADEYFLHFGILGILVVLLFIDLKELMMLGDVGSNALGAIVGLSLISNTSTTSLYIFTGILLFLNLLSEFISFSKIINSFLPLRLLDMLGQTKERKAWLKNKLSS